MVGMVQEKEDSRKESGIRGLQKAEGGDTGRPSPARAELVLGWERKFGLFCRQGGAPEYL